MGGGPELFLQQKQVDVLNKNLSTIEFYFLPSNAYRFSLIDVSFSERNVSKDIKEFFKKYNIKYKENIGELGGGGGLESFGEILQKLITGSGVYTFITDLYDLVKTNLKIYFDYVVHKNKPELWLGFRIVSDSKTNKLGDKELNLMVVNYMTSLILITSELVNKLKTKYSLFEIKYSDELILKNFGYTFSIRLDSYHTNSNSVARILNRIKRIKVKANQTESISFNRLNILRTKRFNI